MVRAGVVALAQVESRCVGQSRSTALSAVNLAIGVFANAHFRQYGGLCFGVALAPSVLRCRSACSVGGIRRSTKPPSTCWMAWVSARSNSSSLALGAGLLLEGLAVGLLDDAAALQAAALGVKFLLSRVGVVGVVRRHLVLRKLLHHGAVLCAEARAMACGPACFRARSGSPLEFIRPDCFSVAQSWPRKTKTLAAQFLRRHQPAQAPASQQLPLASPRCCRTPAP